MAEGIALGAALEIDVEGSSVLANQPIETNVTPLGPSDQIPRPISRRGMGGFPRPPSQSSGVLAAQSGCA
jgi:hypothetical protein